MNNSQLNIRINEWEKNERPREKIFRLGEHALSDAELLAVILRTGIKGQSALDIARIILNRFKNFRAMSQSALSHFSGIKGLGMAKIAHIKAALEIGRRYRESSMRTERIKIAGAADLAVILMPRMRDMPKEVFKAALLDSQTMLIDIIDITTGTVNQAYPIIREIFATAIEFHAASLICVHNHPSGHCQPSSEDRTFTRELCYAGRIMHITVLDHIIIGDNVYYSFADEGSLEM